MHVEDMVSETNVINKIQLMLCTDNLSVFVFPVFVLIYLRNMFCMKQQGFLTHTCLYVFVLTPAIRVMKVGVEALF